MNTPTHNREFGWLMLFAALIGLLAMGLNGYAFGLVDQTDQLPYILRILDPRWLRGDPLVDAAAGFNARFYFAHGVAALGRAAPLWAVALGMQAVCMIALSTATAFAAFTWFGSVRAGMLACSAATVAVPFNLGHEAMMWTNALVSSTPALALAAWGLALAVGGRFVLPALLFGAAAILHPLAGLEIGVLGLVAAGAAQWRLDRQDDGHSAAFRHPMGEALAAIAILAACSLFWAVPQWLSGSSERIPDQEFIATLAWFRAPHHYIPGTWPRMQFVVAGLFLLAVGMAWLDWIARDHSSRPKAWAVAAIFALIGVGYAAGTIFAQVIPVRAVVVAQLFRMSVVAGWLGLILIAGATVARLEAYRPAEASLAALGLLTAGAAFASQAMLWVFRLLEGRGMRLGAAFAMTIAGLWLGVFRWPGALVTGVGFAAAVWHWRTPSAKSMLALPVVALGMMLAVMPLVHPPLRINDTLDRYDGLAEFAREHTPAGAMFLAPMDWGGFRLAADRAVLADWKAISYQDQAMRQWRQRIEAVLGPPNGYTYRFVEFEERYRALTDRRIEAIARQFGVDYAILFKETATEMPVLAAGEQFKLVRVGPEL